MPLSRSWCAFTSSSFRNESSGKDGRDEYSEAHDCLVTPIATIGSDSGAHNSRYGEERIQRNGHTLPIVGPPGFGGPLRYLPSPLGRQSPGASKALLAVLGLRVLFLARGYLRHLDDSADRVGRPYLTVRTYRHVSLLLKGRWFRQPAPSTLPSVFHDRPHGDGGDLRLHGVGTGITLSWVEMSDAAKYKGKGARGGMDKRLWYIR